MEKFKFLKKINPFLIIAFSFLVMIIISACILFLPISLNDGIKVSFIDSMFTATTSLCVTGLVSVKGGIAYNYSIFGKIIIAILMQIGGLGVTTFGLIFIVFTKKKIKAKEQTLIKENFNLTSYTNIRKLFIEILIISFTCELIGAILTFIDFYFVHHMGLVDAIGKSIFHSIASFNNSGIDILGSNSLISYKNDVYLNLITSFLIILGGLGYFVLLDIYKKKFNFKKFILHSKIVITYSIILIILGTLTLYISELSNKDFSFLNSYFMSVSTRTAGFTSVDLSSLRHSTLIIMMILMFIGASSGSAGGGIKTTTFAVFLAYFRSIMNGKNPHLFKRNIKDEFIKKSFMIVILGLIVFIFGTLLITAIEGDNNYLLNDTVYDTYQDGSRIYSSIDFAFEAMSAFGTVGLSTGFTPYFSNGSKMILILMMYIGRVGPVTLAMSFKPKSENLYRYVNEDIAIG